MLPFILLTPDVLSPHKARCERSFTVCGNYRPYLKLRGNSEDFLVSISVWFCDHCSGKSVVGIAKCGFGSDIQSDILCALAKLENNIVETAQKRKDLLGVEAAQCMHDHRVASYKLDNQRIISTHFSPS